MATGAQSNLVRQAVVDAELLLVDVMILEPQRRPPTPRVLADLAVVLDDLSRPVIPRKHDGRERARNFQEMMSYLDRAVTARRERPTPDLITALVEAEVEVARLSDPEIRSMAAVTEEST